MEINHLVAILSDIKERHKRDDPGDMKIAREKLYALDVSDFPDIKFPMSMGIIGDPDAVLYYVKHDWGTQWAEDFLGDAIRALKQHAKQ